MTAVAVLPAGTTDKSANRLKDCCSGADESAVRRRRSRPCVKGLKERGLTTQKVKNHPARGFLTQVSDSQTILFEFDFSAYLFELSLHSFSFSLSKTFFEGVRSTVYELFSFFQTKTGKFFNELNDFEFLTTCLSEYYVEAGFLFGSCTGSGGACCNSNSSSTSWA